MAFQTWQILEANGKIKLKVLTQNMEIKQIANYIWL